VGSEIWKTTGGGSTWISKLSSYFLRSIVFTDNSTGYAVGEGEALKTTDAGENWFSMIDDSRFLRGIHFPSIDTGFIVADSGIIYKTTNGDGFPVGIDDHHQTINTLTIYPNPATNNITIDTPFNGSRCIHNTSGQQLLQQEITEQNTTIDVSTLPSGIYVVKVVGDKGVSVGKFIKQ